MKIRYICVSSIAILCALVAGCAGEPGAPEIGDEVTLDGETWTVIAPGVFERPGENGATLRRFHGKDGFTWLAAQHTAEREKLAARLLEAPEQDRATMLDGLKELDHLIAGAQTRAEELEALEAQQPELGPQGGSIWGWDNSCSAYAETGLDSPGIVDGYSQSYCSGNLYVSASVCAYSDLPPYSACWSMGQNSSVSRYGYAYFTSWASISACAYTPNWGICSYH